MRPNAEFEKLVFALTFVAVRSRRNGQCYRGVVARKCSIVEGGIADQLGKPYGVFNGVSTIVLLGDDNPGVLQCWVRDDVGIYCFVTAELDHEVLLVDCRDREYLTIGTVYHAKIIIRSRYRVLERDRALTIFAFFPVTAPKRQLDQVVIVESQRDEYEDKWYNNEGNKSLKISDQHG